MTANRGFWTEVVVRVLPAGSEPVAELLQDFTGAGVTIEPPIQALGPDEGYELDLDAPLTLRAYFYGAVGPARRAALRRRLRQAGLGPMLAGRLAWRTIREEDWAEAWKTHYEVEHVGRIAIRPAWRDYSAAPGEVVVSLDPGMAFGTGQHPTTRMCLLALQDLLRHGDYVLDLGSGSGVLALAALELGARRAVMTDTEEQAVASSIANAALNGLSERVEVHHGSIDAVEGKMPFDLVLANINAATLARLAPDLARSLKPGAPLIVSGIISEREALCLQAFEAAGLRLERRLEEGDWRAFVLRGG